MDRKTPVAIVHGEALFSNEILNYPFLRLEYIHFEETAFEKDISFFFIELFYLSLPESDCRKKKPVCLLACLLARVCLALAASGRLGGREGEFAPQCRAQCDRLRDIHRPAS